MSAAKVALPTEFELNLGQNVLAHHDIEAKRLYIMVDLSAEGARSASGKSFLVASTRGSAAVHDVKVGLNVFRPARG